MSIPLSVRRLIDAATDPTVAATNEAYSETDRRLAIFLFYTKEH